jgi:chemotaxis family two-component system sensor kinase Cph1
MSNPLFPRVQPTGKTNRPGGKQAGLIALTACFALMLLIFAATALAHGGTHPDEVVLNSYHFGCSWSDNEMTGIVWVAAGFLTCLVLIICLLVLNIRQRRRSEEAIARKAAELEQSNLELQEFSAIAYHDLQEPLRSIGSFVQLLERKYGNRLDQEAREYIGFAVQGVFRMKQLFSDFLAYTAQKRESDWTANLNLGQLLERVREQLHDAIAASGACIEIEPLPPVTGNEQQLALLFQHLIDNAIKFRGEAPPRIRITGRTDGDSLRISVSDNGIGIEPEYRDRIFRIFERLHYEDRYPGTGIGLAICKKIVGLHDGRIWVESAVGKGTTFHFTLPMVH